MKKFIFILTLSLALSGCSNDLEKQGKVDSGRSDKKMELQFSLYNSTELELNNIRIVFPDAVLTYERLGKHSQTEWRSIEAAYRYGLVEFYDNANREYLVLPIDYVGEKPFEKGTLKFIIKSIDTLEQSFELESEFELSR